MENVMLKGFTELSVLEKETVDGAGFVDDAIKDILGPGVEAAKFIYEVGKDIGRASYNLGEATYEFYLDLKAIF